MPAYLYRAVHRHPDGTLGPPLYEQVIEAPAVETAIARARIIDPDMAALGANAVYLTAPEDGFAIWTLHTGRADPDNATSQRRK